MLEINGEYMNENENKISIIVPVYNVEKTIKRCLDSILGQSYTNLEIILIDDGSEDQSGMICDDYASKDKRIKVIHQKNKGLSNARNTGLKNVTGEYIGFVDSDDYVSKDMFMMLITQVIKHEAQVGICSYSINGNYLDEDLIIEEFTGDMVFKKYLLSMLPKKLCTEKQRNITIYGDLSIPNAVWCKLYRTELIKNVKFHDDIIFVEDMLFNIDVFAKSGKILIMNHVGYHYFDNPDSIMKNIKQKYLQNGLKGTDYINELLKEKRNLLPLLSNFCCYHYSWIRYQALAILGNKDDSTEVLLSDLKIRIRDYLKENQYLFFRIKIFSRISIMPNFIVKLAGRVFIKYLSRKTGFN